MSATTVGGGGGTLGSLEPLPGGMYTGTMAQADIYPSVVGIGGIRTQDRALPAFGESMAQAHDRALAAGSIHQGLLGTPAGWFVMILVAVIVGAWYIK